MISACGLMEMCKCLDDFNPGKLIYRNAVSMLLGSVIDSCVDGLENVLVIELEGHYEGCFL